MPSRTRRARERANTRQAIIEAALEVLESEGATALTIRRIAADVDYTAPIVYQHFANKDALVLELVARGYALMLSELTQGAEDPDIDRRMRQVASRYMRFAADHPHLYAAMNGPLIDATERQRAAQPAIDLVAELVGTWADTHDVVLTNANDACEILWGTLHGMISIGSLTTVGTAHARELAEQALRAILLGWRTRESHGASGNQDK